MRLVGCGVVKKTSFPLIMACTITVIIALIKKYGDSVYEEWNFCLHPECLKQTARIRKQLNASVDPCDNFYEFVCSNLSVANKKGDTLDLHNFQNQELLEIYHEKIIDDDHNVVKAAKGLFQSCMDEVEIDKDSFETIKQVIEKVGGWPILTSSNWSEAQFDWQEVLYKFRQVGFPYSIFFNLSVVSDPHNEKHLMYQISPVANDFNGINKKFKMLFFADLFGAPYTQDTEDDYDLVHELWHTLKQYDQPPVSTNVFEKYTIEQYQAKVPSINWLEFINGILLRPYFVTSKQLMLFPPPGNLERYLEIILNTPKRTQANFIMWSMVYEMGHLLYRNMQNDILTAKSPNLEKFCMLQTEKRFQPSPIRLLADRRYLPFERMEAAKKFVSKMKSKFIKMVKTSKWINSRVIKEKIINSTKKISIVVARPDNYYSDDILNNQDLHLNEQYLNMTFISQIAQANKNHASAIYNQIKKKHALGKDYEYIKNSDITFLKERNILFVPSVVVQRFFNEKLPPYFNLGALGTIILHHFNKEFEKFVLNTQTSSSMLKYQKARECVENEIINYLRTRYNASQHEEIKHLISLPKQSQDYTKQIIAERLAYKLFQEWETADYGDLPFTGMHFTPNKLFWISLGTTMCPRGKVVHIQFNKIKMFVSLAKNREFIEDFNCPWDSKIYKQDKCKVEL